MTFRPAGSIVFKTDDGKETVAATSSMGLVHWYIRSLSLIDRSLDIEPILALGPIPEFPGPYNPNFLTVIIGHIERTYGKSPEIAAEFFDRDWYNDLPEHLNDHKIVVQAYRDADPKIVAYEEVCLGILKWLAKHGDIVNLQEPE